jgi:hypothetical protein
MALPMTRARLLVMNSALPVLDYRVPHGMEVEHGSVVIAPLGPRQVMGIVWEPERLPGEEVGDNRLRPLLSVLPVPPLPAPLRRLIEWTADYYCASLASVARMALSSTAALQGGRMMTEYRLALNAEPPKRLTPQRAAALETLQGMQGTLRELAEAASVTEGVLRGMVNGGMMETVRVDLDRPIPPTRPLINPTCPKGSRPPPIRWSMRCVVKPLPLPPRRRDRQRQDRNLFRGRGRGNPPWPTGFGDAARNRTDAELPAPVRGALRGGAGLVALQPEISRTPPGVAGHRRGPSSSGGGRAIGTVPALPAPGPDRGG